MSRRTDRPAPAATAGSLTRPGAARSRWRWQWQLRWQPAVLVWALCAAAHAQQAAEPEAQASAPEAPALAPEVAPPSALDGPMFYQLLLGEMEAQAGRKENAFQVILDGAQRLRDETLFQRAIELAVEARQGDRALSAAKAWRAALPGSTDALRTQVQLLVALEKAGELAEPLRSLIQAMPAKERAAVISGVPRFVTSLPDKAKALAAVEQALTPFVAASDTRTAALTAIGRLALSAQKTDQALSLARRALAEDPSAPGPVLLAMELMPSQPTAEVLVQGFVARPDTPAAMRLAYARALDERQRLGDAAEQLQLAVDQQPDFAAAWMTLAAYRVELRESDAAIAALNRYLALRPAPAKVDSATEEDDEEGRQLAYSLMAQAHEQKREIPAAEQWLDRIAPERVDLPILSRRASLLARQGKLTEARALLRAAPAKGDPDARVRLMAEAQLLRDQRQAQTAYDLLLDAVRQTPDDSVLLYELAMTAERLLRFDDMEALLRRVMVIKPDDHHALNALGYSLADRNLRLDEARKLVSKAAEMAPTDPFIIDSLGWVAFRMGQTDEAVRLLRQSMRARPHVEVAAHLGEVLWTTGQHDEARRIWRDGLAREADNEVLRETLRRLQVTL